MDLTRRQLQILVYLVSEQAWVTSEQIAEYIGTNKKTIQFEIKNIIDVLSEKISIKSNNRKGYLLDYISNEFLERIAVDVDSHKIYSSMNFRASTIITYLLFQTDFVSMQQLADIFFLSKTAISLEIKTIQRWIDRSSNIEIEISPNKGLKIHSTENMRRFFASMIGSTSVFNKSNLEKDFIDQFVELLPTMREILQKILIEHNYIISGEEYIRYTRYLALTLVRGSRGFSLTESSTDRILPIINHLAQMIDDKVGYLLTIDEKYVLMKRLLELNYLYINDSNNQEVHLKLREFEEKIIKFLNLPTSILFTNREFLVNHLQQMITRMVAGHNILNHFAQKTLKRYPLESYLVRRFFPIYFGVLPNLAELSYLILYVAEALEPYRSQEKLLLLSNQPFSILNALKRDLQSVLGNQISRYQIEPVYLFNTDIDKMKAYDILLSTEQEIIFRHKEFSYISNVLNDNEIAEIGRKINAKISENKRKKKDKLLYKYYPQENFLFINKKLENIHILIPSTPELVLLPISSELLFACKIQNNETTWIRQYNLRFPILYQQRRITRILYVSFDLNLDNITLFFSVVADLLNKNNN